MPEFQGGSFDPWGGPGYDSCELLTGPDFQDVFYKHNWAANVKMISYYMFYGRMLVFLKREWSFHADADLQRYKLGWNPFPWSVHEL